MNRPRLFSVSMLFALLLAFAGMAAPGAQRTAAAQAVGDPAGDLLQAAATKMLEYDTMKFKLVYEKGSTKLYTGIKMTSAEGSIERPSKLKATVKTKVGFVKIDVKATVIGDEAWVRAVGISEDYTLPGELSHIIADPVLLLPDLAQAVRDPVVTKIETTKKGEQRIWISGTFDPASIQDEAVRGYAEGLGERPVDIALDAEGRIVSVRLAGQFVSQDSKDVVRRLDISGFGEPVEIEKP
ncbi:MAG TPA: LppX_LprAFG lipoprotein [Thermomicrobiales bacterium]|nr:LppX_LprAFG lipoprotein [Thermomicrobiales bacterium]